jgi:hypothetical protein
MKRLPHSLVALLILLFLQAGYSSSVPQLDSIVEGCARISLEALG